MNYLTYNGKTPALRKQWDGVILRVLSSDGALAQCQGSNGNFYASVPVYSCKLASKSEFERLWRDRGALIEAA